ncbi:MAG: DUF2235 domain-containing protein [Thiotrichaceae bacterium]|nr:DUF2235 domain-containing protein [Thiotrichaceae bacterium]
MEFGETSASADIPAEPEKDLEKISIRYSVFFDGTLNNRSNINQRLVSAQDKDLTEEEIQRAAELKQEMSLEDLKKAKGIYKKRKGDDSYENGYTNVVKLEQYFETEPTPDHALILASYIEGPGSRDKKSDKVFGYAIGVGISGVKNKVKKGVLDVVKKIKTNHFDKRTPIKTLTLDVFGFSRGAAAARNFIHEALFNDAKSVAQRLNNLDYQVGEVKVHFAGLFDTVSSHGLSFSNDTGALKLDAVAHAKEVVHLTAADEHRENFALTTIDSTGGKGREIFLPGVHSDIGGSYREGAGEDQDIYWSMDDNGEEKAQAEVTALTQAGWYKANELTITTNPQAHGDLYAFTEVNLRARRSNISNQYSRIPLHIMARFARDSGLTFDSRFEGNENIPPALELADEEIQAYVGQHQARGAYSSQPADWHDNQRSWLRTLRHDYFHFSARLEIGNGPRYENGKRLRGEYDG